jgi:hypothetical protein
MNDENAKALLVQARRLTCGLMFESAARKTQGGGSAIFIAPRLALTARHVMSEGFRLTGEPRSTKLDVSIPSEHGIRLIQQSVDGDPPHGLWASDHAWETPLTDISLLKISDARCTSSEALPMPHEFLSWRVFPPPVGEKVRLLGYPLSTGRYDDGELEFTAHVTPIETTVTAIYSPYRDRGMYDFPCFEIDAKVDHGFSGGPVFWEDKLCGILSGGSFEDRSIVASLWPVCMVPFGDMPVQGHSSVADLLDSGLIRSDDWPTAKKLIGITDHEPGVFRAVISNTPLPGR